MDRISVLIGTSYGEKSASEKYLPMIKKIGGEICKCYGIGFPRNYLITDEPINKMDLTKIPPKISYIIKALCGILHIPRYTAYWGKIWTLDFMYANKIAKDSSDIIFTSPLMIRSIRKAKRAGKFIVLEAGNSEPKREHERILSEYNIYKIKHMYIYGGPKFEKTCSETLRIADRIISISEVSESTYINAGFDENKIRLIPLTGTDWPIHSVENSRNKPKVFITTAFHSFIKGTHRLLVAWRQAEIKDIPLLVVGNVCEDMQEFIRKYGPFENVKFIGPRGDLRTWYDSFDAVGILMSLSEGAVRVTPEMMSFGFPMIVSPDATCDLVIDGYNGRIVDPFDGDGLVKALRYFADDWNRVYALRQNVLDSVRKRTTKDFSEELGEYLLSLLQDRT